jgi:hypothetical protein
MALMYKNFYEGVKELEGTVRLRGRTYYLYGEPHTESVTIPFHKLGAGGDYTAHDPRAATENTVYLIRRWEPVRQSLKKLKHNVPRWYAGDLFTHMQHIYIALKGQPFVVYYEQLLKDPERVLMGIELHFGLNLLHDEYITEVGYCGFKE